MMHGKEARIIRHIETTRTRETRNKKHAKERRSKDETKKTFAAALRACGGASRLRRRFAPVAALRAIEKHKKRQKVR